ASSTNPYTIRTKDYYRRNWGYSALDSLIGYYNVRQLKSHWPFTPIGTKSNFIDTFKPISMEQTLAFSTIKKPDTEVENLHNILGGYYRANKKFDLALKEYKALIGINPTLSSYYNITANLLFELGDLFAAEKYLKRSVKYVKTYFAFYLLGEIEYIKNNIDNAIDAYNSALQLADEDEIEKEQRINVLGKLYALYAFKEDKNNMASIEKKLAEYGQRVGNEIPKPEFEYSKYVPFNIRDKYKKALDFETTNTDSSLHYLSLCLMINDSPIVNKTMGDILLQKQDTSSVFYYTKVYETYKKSPDFLSKYCLSLIEKDDISTANFILNELIAIDSSNRDIPSLKAAINQ
ncbi:MAG: tetratricopeptide repeat protein, partial [Melioribacteraceae bacterium]|nr:tetratricopeptide repeat protein [Melioribacteraceae bacterium]